MSAGRSDIGIRTLGRYPLRRFPPHVFPINVAAAIVIKVSEMQPTSGKEWVSLPSHVRLPASESASIDGGD